MSKHLFLLILILISLFLRIYKIDQVPASLYYDEVDYGYQARSLIETHKDYRGEFSPFYVHSFNDIRAPIPAYFTVLTTLLFTKPEFQVRMPFVISGTIVVGLIFLLMQLWTKKLLPSFFVALIFTINPWQIQFSRFSHEVGVMQLFYLLALVSFFYSIKNKKYFFLLVAAVLLSLCLYTYRTMSFYAPLTFLILTFFYRKKLIIFGYKKLFFLIIISSIIIIPFLIFTTIKAPDVPRINQLAITSDQAIPIWIQRNREIDSGDLVDSTLGKRAVFYSFIFHNKPLSWAYSFFSNYLQTFSSDFLFLKGDPNPRHSIGNMGELYFIDVLALIFGLFYLGKNLKNEEFRFLLVWFLSAPIPAALTVDGAKHGARLFIFSAPLLIIVGLGWWFIFKYLKKLKFSKVLILSVILIWGFQFTTYFHRYLVHFPIESSGFFGYGFKQAMLKISKEESNYKKIKMVNTKDPPMIYYLFWSKTDPIFLQEYGGNFSDGRIIGKRLDKYKVIDKFDIDNLEDNTLYLITTSELQKSMRDNISEIRGVRFISSIKYPDQQVAFYIITKKN